MNEEPNKLLAGLYPIASGGDNAKHCKQNQSPLIGSVNLAHLQYQYITRPSSFKSHKFIFNLRCELKVAAQLLLNPQQPD
jgi:hypothetical protein